MTIGREMLADLAPDTDANPLGLIGLSREILAVGLTTDELYSVCKRFAKIMLAEVHEDRVLQTPRTKYLQARFSAVMGSLRDISTFEAALGEFQRSSSLDKSETNQLRRDLEITRGDRDSARQEAEILRAGTHILRQTLGRERRAAIAERESDLKTRIHLKNKSEQQVVDARRYVRQQMADVFQQARKVRERADAWLSKVRARSRTVYETANAIAAERKIIAREREALVSTLARAPFVLVSRTPVSEKARRRLARATLRGKPLPAIPDVKVDVVGNTVLLTLPQGAFRDALTITLPPLQKGGPKA